MEDRGTEEGECSGEGTSTNMYVKGTWHISIMETGRSKMCLTGRNKGLSKEQWDVFTSFKQSCGLLRIEEQTAVCVLPVLGLLVLPLLSEILEGSFGRMERGCQESRHTGAREPVEYWGCVC